MRVVSSFGLSSTIPQKGHVGFAMMSLPENLLTMILPRCKAQGLGRKVEGEMGLESGLMPCA